MKLFDGYSFKARAIPCLIIAMPYAIFVAIVLNHYLPIGLVDVVRHMISGIVGTGIGWSVVIYCLSGRVRDKGRELQDKYFKKGLDLPTTRMLLWTDNTFTKERKHQIHLLLNTKYNLKTLSPDAELENERLARQLITEATDVIRPMIKDGVRLVQYNIRFGFARNLAAGSVYGLIGSIVGAIVCFEFAQPFFGWAEGVIGLCFLFKMVRAKSDIERYGEEYAKALWVEFLACDTLK